MGWMGEKAMLSTRVGKTNTPYRLSFYKFHMLTTPSSLPVAKVQYLEEAYAQVSSKWVSLMSLMIWN